MGHKHTIIEHPASHRSESSGGLYVDRHQATHLQEDLEDTTGLLVDQARDTLDTATAGQSADGRLGDTLDVVTEDLAVALGAALAKALASLAASRHGY